MTKIAVVGGGNAGLCAAISARENGAEVHVLERAPYELRGGNSRFTGGAIRTTYESVGELQSLMPELSHQELANAEFGVYTRERFLEDLGKVTQYRCDPALADHLVSNSLPTLQWLRANGVRFLPLYGRQSFEIDGKQRFWGGLTVEAWGGGPGLIDSLTEIATSNGVRIHYESHAVALLRETNQRLSVEVSGERKSFDRVILACGGFEANAAWRARYLGPLWDLAKVRGTSFNTGDGHEMAMALGAQVGGHWSGCHAVAWDLNAPEYGDLSVGDGFQKHSYPLGVVVNLDGERFVDEGADFRNYTYAKYGAEILRQPRQQAWQIFDSKVTPLLRDEYRIQQVTKVEANSIQELGSRINSMNVPNLVHTIDAFNAAVDTNTPFNPAVKDGRATQGLTLPKSHWANALDTPPFQAFGVTCGITFTFGGLAVDEHARVLAADRKPIPNLYAAGEIVGGLYYFNYPGGCGLIAGAVFGRTAGISASAR